MPYTYDVKAVGLDEIVNKTKPELYRKPLHDMFLRLGNLARNIAIRKAPRNTGELQRSIMADITPMSARIFSIKNYAVPVEMGRRKNSRMPPRGPIEAWLRSKGKDPRAWFVVARAIARRGIKGRFFMRAAYQAVAIKMPLALKTVERQIAASWEQK
jgi:hypothetical protein